MRITVNEEDAASDYSPSGTTRALFIRRAVASGVGIAGASALAGCGGKKKANAVAAGPSLAVGVTPKIAAKFKSKTIGVPIYTTLDENEATILSALKQASEKAGLNWKFLSDDTKADQAAAQRAVQSYVTRKVDAIIDIVVPAAFVQAQFEAAQKAGIPVIGNYTFGASSAAVTADYSPPLDQEEVPMSHFLINDQRDELGRKTVKVAMMDVSLDVVKPRHWSFEAIAANFPGVEIIAKDFNVSATDTVADATRRAKAIMQKHPDLSCFWCGFPPVALPVASAVAQAGKTDVQVYGHATGTAGAEALREKNNPFRATTWVDFPYSAYGMVDLVLQALAGGKPDRQISYLSPVPTAVFSEKNINSEVPEGTDAKAWTFARGAYVTYFLDRWNTNYGE
jgi:ABC-type sugar transport system substrate-binding protein